MFPPETRRCTRLVSRSKTCRDNWLTHPLIYALSSAFVDKTTSNFYGEQRHTYTSKFNLSISISMEIGPGGKAQRLHRDDKNYHVHHANMMQTGYQPESDVLIAFLIPGVDTRQELGATNVIPGSHLWGDERAPKVDEAVSVELQKGDAVCFLGSTYHGGGENRTRDEKRPMHGLFFTRGYYRQEVCFSDVQMRG